MTNVYWVRHMPRNIPRPPPEDENPTRNSIIIPDTIPVDYLNNESDTSASCTSIICFIIIFIK